MSDNSIYSNSNAYRVYATGFVGSDSVVLTPEIELEKSLFYGVGMMKVKTGDFKYSTCVLSKDLKQKNVEKDIFLIDQVLHLALKHFGNDFEEWIRMHDTPIAKKSSLVAHENVDWIRETLEWVSGVRDTRRISTVVWASVINGASGISSDSITRQLHDTVKVAKARLGIPGNGYLSTKEVLKAWVKKPGGITDLKDTLAMMYTQA